jgi:hypothetical protein
MLKSLSHEDARSLSNLDVTMSSLFPVQPPPLPLARASSPVHPPSHPAPAPAVPLAPPPIASSAPPILPSPTTSSLWLSELLRLPDIKDPKGYLDHHELIQEYLCLPDYSTKCSDALLITNLSDFDASHFWESLICAAVKNGSL